MDDEAMVAMLDEMDEVDAEKRIKEWVMKEKKIVTIKLVSNRLKIPLAAAKKHLERFFSDEARRKKLNLHAVYYLSGYIEKDGLDVFKAGLVRDKYFDEAKERLDSIASSHIFSVQCADIKNAAAALMADSRDSTGKNDYNHIPISCANAKRKVDPEAARVSMATPTSKYFDEPAKEKEKSKPILEPNVKQKETPAPKPADKDTVSKKAAAAAASNDTIPKTTKNVDSAPKNPQSKTADTAPKKPVVVENKGGNEKKRPAKGMDGPASKKQATLTQFFGKKSN